MRRTCNTCGITKDIKAFKICGKGSNGKSYRQNECRLCVSKKEKSPPKEYICVRDPTNTYAEGSHLTHGHIQKTLDIGYLPPGSQWRVNKRKQVWVVKGNEHWHNLLECVKNPDESYLESVKEKQRLVRI